MYFTELVQGVDIASATRQAFILYEHKRAKSAGGGIHVAIGGCGAVEGAERVVRREVCSERPSTAFWISAEVDARENPREASLTDRTFAGGCTWAREGYCAIEATGGL